MEFREELLARGRELHWHPPYMQARYENWINGLAGDWCISRQRFFGVPFPVWYKVRADGSIDHDSPSAARRRSASDRSIDRRAGRLHRGAAKRAGGFAGDPDVMDTWATSSLTPQIVSRWEEDADLFARVFPMDVRPQAHDIIRTWLFDTVLRSQFEFNSLPWKHAAISGWVLDPDRKKMSKSKGNVVTPMALLEEHGSDGVRYWAASGRSGTDTAFDPGQMKVGRRLAIKLLNASRFVLAKPEPNGPVTAPVDRGLLTMLARIVRESTTDLEAVQLHACPRAQRDVLLVFLRRLSRAREGTPVRRSRRARSRRRPTARSSARCRRCFVCLRRSCPFVTEEVWSWWRRWIDPQGGMAVRGRSAVAMRRRRGRARCRDAALRGRRARRDPQEEVRRTASAQDGRVALAVVHAPPAMLALLPDVERDLRAAGSDSAARDGRS